MDRSLMDRELRGAMRDVAQRLRLRLPSGDWAEIPVASDALTAASADTLDGADFAAEGISVTLRRSDLPCAADTLVGRPVELDGRRLVVAAVTHVPGDIAVTLTLARRSVGA